jgi:hypothetical protein
MEERSRSELQRPLKLMPKDTMQTIRQDGLQTATISLRVRMHPATSPPFKPKKTNMACMCSAGWRLLAVGTFGSGRELESPSTLNHR